MKRLPIFAAALLIAATAYAHGPAKGPNGGPQVDAGDYHVELVRKKRRCRSMSTTTKTGLLTPKASKATGTFVVAGKPQRIELKPESANKLTGTAPCHCPPN